MKNFLQKTCLLVLMLVMGASAAWADWTRCTSVSDLTSGGTFIIGYEATANSGKIVPMKNSGGTATATAAGYMAAYTTGIDMAKVTSTADYEISIVASTKVKDAVCIKIGDNYLGNTNTKNNCKLFTEESATTAFGVSVGTNDVFTLKIAENSTYHTLQYNSSAGSERFAVYGGAQKNLVVYKKTSGEDTKQSYALTFASNSSGSCSATVDGQLIGNGDKVEEGKTVTVSCTPSAGYAFNAWNVYRTGNQYNYVKVSENNTFTMPAAAVTIDAYYREDSTSGGGTQVTGGTYVLKDLANITATDEVLVVWTPQAGGAYALSNDNGTSAAPTAVPVTISNGTIVTNADNISWNVSYDAEDKTFALYPNGSNTTWLYATNTNNGVKVGTNDNKVFVMDKGYIKNVATSRYLGVYDGSDIRCYTTNSGNIANQSVAFYVKTSDEGGGETGGEGGDTGGGTLSPIPNFIQNTTIEIALNGESYDVRTNLNIPKDYNTETYAITTTINGLTQKDGEYACIYPYLAFEKTGTYPVHVVASATDKYAETTGDFTVVVFDPNEPTVDPDEPTSNVYASLAELVAAGKPSTTARKVTVTLTNEKITNIFVTSQGYRNGIFLQVGEQEIEIYSRNVPEEWIVDGTVSGTLTDCDWKLYSSTWELCPANWDELQYTAPAPEEVQQYAVTYTAPEHGTLVVMNGEEQLTSGAKVDNGTRVTLNITPDASYEFEKWEAIEDGAVKYTCTSDRRYYDVAKDVEFKAYFRKAFVEPQGMKVTWDLSKDETTDASADHLLWRNNIAMMETVKAKGATNANNYYPGTANQSYESTRFYTNNSFVVTPASGITINAIVAECTTNGYTDKLVESSWTNANVESFGTKVVITPTDGTSAVSAVLGGATGATAVTVYYTGTSQGWPEVTTYNVNVDEKVVGGTISASAESAEAGTTITLTATPAEGYEFTSWNVTLVEDASAVEVKDNKFTMPEGDVNVSAVFTAQEVTPDVPSEHTFVAEDVWGTTPTSGAVVSATQNDCTMLCKKGASSSSNCSYVVVANNPNDMRIYAGGTVTLFNLTGMSQVVFNISAQGLKRLATLTADSGTIAYDVDSATVTWTATTPVKTVTFTVGDKADYGTDGASKAGQLDFTSFDVVEAAAQGEIRDVAKYIDGLNLEVKAFSVEELQTIINSTLGK